MKYFLILFLATIITSCSTLTNIPNNKEPFIIMQRTACYGTCPQYTISVYCDGTIKYDGKLFVEKIGCFYSTINHDQVRAIKTLIDEISFFNLSQKYDAPITDIPSVVTKVNLDGKKHQIIDRYKGPMVLKKLYALLDSSFYQANSNWRFCD